MSIELEGVFPPITTPFDADGRLCTDKLESNLERWNETGLSGYVVLGSNGESCLLDEEEKRQVMTAARRRIPSSKRMIVGTDMEATEEVVRFARLAADLGAECLLVNTPHYYKNRMTDDALFTHFTRVADASPVPILLYSVPDFTGLPLNPALVARLSKHPQVVGMKYSTRDVFLVSEVIRLCDPGFWVFIGTAPVLLPAVAVGVCGAIVAVACALPEMTVELFRTARQGSVDSARVLQNLLTPPAVTVTGRFGVAGLKAAMDICGYYGGKPRRPLLPLTEEEHNALSQVFQAVLPSRSHRRAAECAE